MPRHRVLLSLLASLALLLPAALQAQDVQFENLAADPASGLDYQRARSASFADIQALREASLTQPIPPDLNAGVPTLTAGIPGVALFDHDGDGDLDIYVTNGPGAANSLYSSQLAETGELRFVDRAVEAGVDASDQDSNGVCFGDLDNDGDAELVVLGRNQPNLLFENLGNGQFAERTGALGPNSLGSTSCSVGDIDGDGRLDVAVANGLDFDNPPDLEGPLFDSFHPNQLLRNLGGLAFEDVSLSSGIRDLVGLPPGAEGRSVSWAIALVDVDLDGDADLVQADDQGPVPTAANGGLDIGYVHVLLNDGSGLFTDEPVILDAISAGSWMGLAFGDFDCDGTLDIFGSNFGDYGFSVLGLPYAPGDQATRWLLGVGDGTFVDPGVGALGSSVFGWGNAVADYDNDGDQDLIYHGGMDLNFIMLADNPGVVLANDGCGASFTYQPAALRGDYVRRNVRGVARGDLNGDGFVDLVTASNLGIPDTLPLLPMPISYANDFDATALFTSVFGQTPDGLVWTGLDFDPGSVTVEISNAGNANGWATATLLGTVGLTTEGRVNRDGIGAVVSMTPDGGVPVLVPIVGGSSHASQHSLEAHFGLGTAASGTLDVLWPGGVRNRLYNVHPGERLLIPEIPCSFTADWPNLRAFIGCANGALLELQNRGILTRLERARLLVSSVLAYFEEREQEGGLASVE